MKRLFQFLLILPGVMLIPVFCFGEVITIEVPQRTKPVEFETDVVPILRANCIACHHARKASGGLILETPFSIIKGGESGPAVVAGKADLSLLLKVAMHQDEPAMPPADNTVGARALTPVELGMIKLWIDQGATGDVSTRPIRWQTLPSRYQPALACAVTPDGQLTIFSRGNRLFVHQVTTGRLETTLEDSELHDPVAGGPPLAHVDLVRSLAVNPAGDLVASGSFREVKVWRRPRTTKSETWTHNSSLQTLATSHDGRLVAIADDQGRIHMAETSTAKGLRPFPASQGPLTGLEFSLDGRMVFTAGSDRFLRAWNVEDGLQIGKVVELKSAAQSLLLLNKGMWLVAGCQDGTVVTWEVKDLLNVVSPATPRQIFQAHQNAVTALAADPGSETRFYSGADDGLIRRWDADSGKQLAEQRHEAPIIALSVAGQRMASASVGKVALWNLNGERLAQWSDDPQLALEVARIDAQIGFTKAAISHAQQDLKSYEGLIRIAKVRMDDIRKAEEELQKTQKTRDEKKSALEKVRTENGKTEPAEKGLADAETAVSVAQTVIDRAKAISNRTSQELIDAEAAVAARESHLKELEASRIAVATDMKDRLLSVRSLALLDEGRRVAIGCESGSLHLFDSEAGLWSESAFGHDGPVLAIGGTPGKLITVSTDHKAIWWTSPQQWRLDRVIGGSRQPGALVDRVLSLDFSPDGKFLATGGGIPSRTSELKIWDVATGELVRDFPDAHTETVFAVRFSPLHHQLASASGDRFIKIFDTETGAIRHTLAGHAGHVTSLAWKSDGRMLASAGADNALKLWDAESGLPLRTMKGTTYQIGPYKRDITGIAFIGNSEQILAASGDGTVRIHRTTSENDILTFKESTGYQHSVAATPDGRTNVAAGSDGVVRIWSGHEQAPRRTLSP